MQDFKVPTREQLDPQGQAAYDQIKSAFGFVPNLFATIGYSGNALASYMAFQGAQAKGSYTLLEREAVYVAVSQVTGCRYCQSAHTAILKMNKQEDAETLLIRQGQATDPKIRAITRLAQAIAKTHGRPDQALLQDFFAFGYGEKALIDLIALVTDKLMANYTHNITQIPIDFPIAEPLEKETAAALN